ncbi:sulfur carrier protein ThiS [Verrucomicrobiota bacterium]
MNIQVNGEKQEIRAGKTLADLAVNFNRSNKRVAVLLNDDLIPKGKQAGHVLKEGDRVEILTFAGGG